MGGSLAPVALALAALFMFSGGSKRGRGGASGSNGGSGPGGSGSDDAPTRKPTQAMLDRVGQPCSTGVTGEYAQIGPDGTCTVFWAPNTNAAFAEAVVEVAARQGVDPCAVLDGTFQDVTIKVSALESVVRQVYVYPRALMDLLGETLSYTYDLPADTFVRALPGTNVVIGADDPQAVYAWGETPAYWVRTASKMALAMTIEVVCQRKPVT